jgi:hypothetical protein
MSQSFIAQRTVGAAIAGWWATFYTFGLPAASRERRRQELQSDLWEHQDDRLREGAKTGMVGLEILSRTVRGAPADILWRFRLEGPKMQIHLPFERVAGVLLLLLVVLVPASGSISGYDPDRAGWAGELRRLGEHEAWKTDITAVFQMLCGLALIGAAVGFYLALQTSARGAAAFAGFALAAAGVLVIAASAIYRALAEMAHDFVAGRAGEDVLVSSRALAIAMEALVQGVIILLAVGVCALALAAHRQSLVPRWLGKVAVAGSVLLVIGVLLGAVSRRDAVGEASWTFVMGGFVLVLVWLVTSGFTLLLGRRSGPTQADRGAEPA